ncbi:MAG: hypothetical protein ATN35_09050 [Epulopiscium sp. Nele67-Bin004]|nr:MAG: hypothetical protein ATN35_09050 [Epulopiscium sp. Nele67-Bin004]
MEDKIQQLIEYLNSEVDGGNWKLLHQVIVEHNLQIITLSEYNLKLQGYQYIEGVPDIEYVHYIVLQGKVTATMYKAESISQLDLNIEVNNCGYEVNLNPTELQADLEEGLYEIGILTLLKGKNEFVYTDLEEKLYITPNKVTQIYSYEYQANKLNQEISQNIENLKVYNQLVQEFGKYIEIPDKLPVYTEGPPKIIWVCWLQEIENAPPVVKACYKNLMNKFSDYKKVLITATNYMDYVKIDSIILEKWKKGIISNTMFSDIVRLELLVKYGGVWIDSTILCTTDEMPKFIEQSPLFMYRFNHKRDVQPSDNSLIGSCKGHILLKALRDILIRYWHEKDELVNYSILNMFTSMLVNGIYSAYWDQVPYLSNRQMIMTYHFLYQEYDEQQWNFLMENSPFYKLTYKLWEDTLNSTNTYYAHIIKIYS